MQFLRDIGRIAAEEFHILHAVACSVHLGISNGLRHDLGTDDFSRLLRHDLRDSAGAAVEIQHQLLTGELRVIHSTVVKLLRLIAVDLIERRYRQSEREAAEGIHDGIFTPESAVRIAENRVAAAGIGAQHHAHRLRYRLAQHVYQFGFMRQFLAVDQQADETLTAGIGSYIQVAQQALPGFLIVTLHGKATNVLPHGLSSGIGLGLLNQALRRLHHVVGTGAIETHLAVSGDGILTLVAVTQRIVGTDDFLHLHGAAAQTGQSILHSLTLGNQLLDVVHVAKIAAATLTVVGAIRLAAVFRGCIHRHHFAEGGIFQHLQHQNVANFTADSTVDKDYLTVNAGNAQSFGGISFDGGAIYFVLLQSSHGHSPLCFIEKTSRQRLPV